MKPLAMQTAIKTHMSQPAGGAFDGQHGMSFAISSVAAAIWSAIACIETSEGAAAMTGPAIGANTRPAITRTASSRRMAEYRFTGSGSHKRAAMESLGHSYHELYQAVLIVIWNG